MEGPARIRSVLRQTPKSALPLSTGHHAPHPPQAVTEGTNGKHLSSTSHTGLAPALTAPGRQQDPNPEPGQDEEERIAEAEEWGPGSRGDLPTHQET